MKRVLLLMIVVLAVGALVPTAHAGLALYLDDPGTLTAPIIIHDGGVGDSAAVGGAVAYIGSFDSWSVTVSTATSKPVLGAVSDPHLHFNVIAVSSAGGTLLAKATDTGFFAPAVWAGTGYLKSELGGTTVGSISATQSVDLADGLFVSPTGIDVAHGPFGPGAFSDSGSIAFAVGAAPFSLTEVVTATHTGAGASSFDIDSHVVPVPGAAMLGILGLGAAGLRLRKKKSV